MKPKFLQNSKDMLSRSFNPAKCKTSLKLAASRSKLLRNKKEIQVAQMKRDIARLLESGEDQTARIRVEHVIREEKLMAAYDLLEIYCELVTVRLPVIESQKNCPSDLKEAITSLVFASLRCGDVPELLDVKKHFSAKYGKDFTKAAIELRPDCGVSRLLVEKLSAVAPDAQTKIKVLSAIAKEHNISWDPSLSVEKESAPPGDLLSGSSNVEKKNEPHAEPPRHEAANFQAYPNNSDQISGANAELQAVVKPPELRDDGTQLLQGATESISLDKERWNMEFKDATSAAQAAAESAEQASIAAKAAAEFAKLSEINTQNSQEPQKSEINSGKVEGTVIIHESLESSINTTSEGDRTDQLETESTGSKKDAFDEDGRTASAKYSYDQLPSESKKSMIDHSEPIIDHCYPQNSMEGVDKVGINMNEQLFKYGSESANDWPEKSERNERMENQGSISLAPPYSSISDDYNIFADSKDQDFNHNAGENTFVGNNNVGETQRETSHDSSGVIFDKLESDTDDHQGLVMGNTSDDSEPEIHTPSQDLSTKSDSFSESMKPTASLFFTTGNSTDSFTENLSLGNISEVDNHATVKFDVSDGESSEADEDNNRSEDFRKILNAQNETGDVSQSQHQTHESVESTNADKGYSPFARNQSSLSSDNESESEEIYGEGSKGFVFESDDAPEILSTAKDDEFVSESIPQIGSGLSFGKLTGGLRHKGYNRLSFLKNGLDVPSSDNEDTKETTGFITTSEETTTLPTNDHTIEQTKISKVRPKMNRMSDYGTSGRTQKMKPELDSDSSEEEESIRTSSGYGRDDYDYDQISVERVKTKPSSTASKPIFSSDDSDLDDHTPKQSLTWKNHRRGGISRRTKASASGSGTSSFSKTRLKSEAVDSDESTLDTKLTSSKSRTSKESESLRKGSDKLGNVEQPTTDEVASSPIESKFKPPKKPEASKSSSSVMQDSRMQISSKVNDSDAGNEIESSASKKSRKPAPPSSGKETSEPNSPNLVEEQDKPDVFKATSTSTEDSKIFKKPSVLEESSVKHQKTEAFICSENPKADEAEDKASSDSPRKASHVHPKLPDYDMLLQFLGKDRS